MKNNIQSYLSEKTQKVFFWALSIILFLPVVVLPPTFRPSGWSRVILFKIIITFLLAFIFYKFFYKKDFSFFVFTKKNPVFTIFIILSLFFLCLLISTIFSIDPRFSFFGSPSRAGGFMNLLFYFVFAIFLSIFIKQEKWEKLLKINFIAGAIASIFALIQYFGAFNKIFVSFAGVGAGVPSFLGNSTFLAIYMIFLAFLASYFVVKEKSRNSKILYGILLLLFLFTLLISGSRAGYLGFLLGSTFYFLLYPKKLKVLRMAGASILALAVIFVLVFNFFPQLGEKNNLLKTMSSRLSIQKIATDLAGNRLAAWNMTWQAIKGKPLFGWGPENFYVGFEKHYSPANDSLRKEWWDRPHNIFLDVFVNNGIFALILYVAFWILLLIKLQNFKKTETDQNKIYLAHAIQAMFLGYLVVLFFNFDEFPSYLMAFFFVGLSIYLISSHGDKKEVFPLQKSFLSDKPVVISLLILALLFVWFWNIKPLYKNEQIVFASNLIASQKCDRGLSIAESVYKNAGIIKTFSALSYVDLAKKCGAIHPENEIEYSQKTVNFLKTVSKIQPNYSRTWLSLGSFSNVLSAREEDVGKRKEMLLESRKYLEKARELSPNRQEVLVELETNYMLSEDYEPMKNIAQECIKISPAEGSCYWYLGIAQIFTGDQVNGKKNIEESAKKGLIEPPLLQLGVAYLSQKNYKDAAEVYYKLTERYHENAGYHGVAAALAKEIGDYQRAAKETIQVFRIQPENPESLQFLEMLFETKSNDPVVKSSVAFIYVNVGKKQGMPEMLNNAKYLYQQLTRDYPNNADYHYWLAVTYKELSQYYLAREQVILSARLSKDYVQGAKDFLSTLPIEENLKVLPN